MWIALYRNVCLTLARQHRLDTLPAPRLIPNRIIRVSIPGDTRSLFEGLEQHSPGDDT